MASFKDLPINQTIQENLNTKGFTEPTEIQEKAIEILLGSDNVDFHGQAQTGTGKTLAFGIPLLQRIDISKKMVQGLVVAPTRELAVQIFESLKSVSQDTGVKMSVMYGGVSIENQMRDLKRGTQIVIGTPGRLNDLIRRGALKLDKLHTLVLDEADIMLEMGFKEEIDKILKDTPSSREIWLFSATVKPGISQIMKQYMKDTVSVKINQKAVTGQTTEQYYCIVPFRLRLQALIRFIESVPGFYGFVFCRTKLLTAEIAEELIKRGYNAGSLHGDMSQVQRNSVIKKFKNKTIEILVATDVAARGIDVANVSHVINYSIPEDIEGYVHRIGRTGRAGKKGVAITFVTKSELRVFRSIEKRFKMTVRPIDVPSKDQIINSRVEEVSKYINDTIASENLDINDKLMGLVNNLSSDDLKKVAAASLSKQFLDNLGLSEVNFAKTEDMTPDEWQEISLNVGSDDGIFKDDIKKFLTETDLIAAKNIMNIRVLKRKTFVKLAVSCSPQILNAFKDRKLGGRSIRINITCLVNSNQRGQRGSGFMRGKPRGRGSRDSRGRDSRGRSRSSQTKRYK